ncbi:MAG: hypothetical protein ABEH90_06275 [Halolamina sp.]
MSLGPHSDQEVAGVVVGGTIAGMAIGAWLLLSGARPHVGWFLFIISFGLWMFAFIIAWLILWDAGYFDR